MGHFTLLAIQRT